jgi:hypothetical protein
VASFIVRELAARLADSSAATFPGAASTSGTDG